MMGMKRIFPFLQWLPSYRKSDLPGDFVAGLTVAIMLVPQSMAYAILAGLPPEVGLYASILPMMVYGFMGSTPVLTLGPTAITSVMVLSSISHLADQDTEQYLSLALTLALCLGVIFLLMGILRLGFIVNLLSEPVLIGYINAAALVIIFSQVHNLLGVSIRQVSHPYELIWETLRQVKDTNPTTLFMGLSGIGIIVYFRTILEHQLARFQLNATMKIVIVRSGPLVVAALGITVVYVFRLDTSAGVGTVGDVPSGFPSLAFGNFDFTHMEALIAGAMAIAFVGFMEDMSTIKSLAGLSRQRINANQQLIAMGAANVAAAISGGYPVTTSISRSAVNYAAGANTGMSSVVASIIIAVVVMFFTPLFYYLPTTVLAAIVITSVVKLINVASIRQLWRYSNVETIPFTITFLSVLVASIELGILIGIIVAIALHLWHTSRPHITRLGRIGKSEHYRNVTRSDARSIDHVLIVRIDESLYFANSQYLDNQLRNMIAEAANTQYLILVCSAINTIDASALLVLTELIEDFHQSGVEVYLVDIKVRVLARMRAVHFVDQVGRHRFFDTIHEAVLSTGYLMDGERKS
jgi:sulfate permease, SulP family